MKKNKKMNLKFLKAHNLFYNLFHIMKIPLNLYLNHIQDLIILVSRIIRYDNYNIYN